MLRNRTSAFGGVWPIIYFLILILGSWYITPYFFTYMLIADIALYFTLKRFFGYKPKISRRYRV